MGYRTRELAQVVGLTGAQVRSYVYNGLLEPLRGSRREYHYSFTDLMLLRIGSRLARNGVRAGRVASALHALRGQLPDGIPLSSVDLETLGDTVLARDDQGLWDPESQQQYFGFAGTDLSVDESAKGDEPMPVVVPFALASRRVAQLDVEPAVWYERALALEENDAEAAIEAYRHVLALDPTDADARANVGRLHHEAGRIEEAEQEFRLALVHDPCHATAAFNLGVTLEDGGRLQPARDAYLRALELDPELAVAHYNLSGIAEQLGDKAGAVRHLSEYKRSQAAP
jgi:tetratricopeptide (TPR) repeat protein